MACIAPFIVTSETGSYNPVSGKMEYQVPVPCGSCAECVSQKVNQLLFRIQQTDKAHFSSHFVTLTYDTLELADENFNCRGELQILKDHLKAYFRSLRDRMRYTEDPTWEELLIKSRLPSFDRSSPAYFGIGEYGDHTERPHYHAIVIGSSAHFIEKAWPYGYVHVEPCNYATIKYTLKYLHKDIHSPKWWDHVLQKYVDRWDVAELNKPFRLSSNRLGMEYLVNEDGSWTRAAEWHRHPEKYVDRSFVYLRGGHRVTMPRYFKEVLYTKDQLLKIRNNIHWDHAIRNQDFDRSWRSIGVDPILKRQSMYQNKLNIIKSSKSSRDVS